MEIRELEIFLTLAEELHFGRTAQRLHVTAARVSQAIKKQERRIGAKLFDRNSHHVALTPIGKQLYDDLLPVYRGLLEGVERARRTAGQETEMLRLGMISTNGEDLRPFRDAFTERRPGCRLQIRSVGYDNPFDKLRDGTIDVLLAWLPVQEPDLTVGPLVYTEQVMLLVSPDHALAGRESVSYEVFADETVLAGVMPDYWRNSLIPTHTPSGRPIAKGPEVTSNVEVITYVSSGEAVSAGHAHGLRYYVRPDIVFLPVHDAPPARWALVWRTNAVTDAIRDLARTVSELGPREL
ncbi:LysR family transcriptional regulator [Streptomyces boninensis]|uniref:LysR family transcriptional regulator n=1 Tax=Streptomyces boninensis TaxID=2039455 RepID=UPI003B2158F7